VRNNQPSKKKNINTLKERTRIKRILRMNNYTKIPEFIIVNLPSTSVTDELFCIRKGQGVLKTRRTGLAANKRDYSEEGKRKSKEPG